MNGDNFGMVLKGEEASYVQQILFQNIILRSLHLGKLKIHSENPAERLSRRPTNDWLSLCYEDLTELDLAEKTVGITDEDYDTLSRVVAEGLHEVIDLELSGRIKIGERIPRAGYFIDQTTREELDTRGATPTPTNPASNNSNPSNNSGGAENRPRNLFYGDDISLSAVKMDLSTKGAIYVPLRNMLGTSASNQCINSTKTTLKRMATRLYCQSMYRSFLQRT